MKEEIIEVSWVIVFNDHKNHIDKDIFSTEWKFCKFMCILFTDVLKYYSSINPISYDLKTYFKFKKIDA